MVKENKPISSTSLAKLSSSRVAIFSAAFLAALKFLVGFILSSLVVIASAFDSLVDVLASTLNYFSIKKAVEPPDVTHPYGHGKVESLAALTQGFFLLFSLLYLAYSSLISIIKKEAEIKEPLFGALAILFSLAVTFFLARFLEQRASETGSVALKADAWHYLTDLYTNLAAILALVLVFFTGYQLLDPIFALLASLYLLAYPLKLMREAIGGLVDKSLSSSLLEELNQLIFSHAPYVVDYHNLRSRATGSKKIVDFHLVICRQLDFQTAHRLVEHIEREVEGKLGSADVLVHYDPCPGECELSWETCEIKKRKEDGSLKLWQGALKTRLHSE